MSAPPRDRMSIGWRAWDFDTPFLLQWNEGAAHYDASSPGMAEDYWLDEHEIAAWAECPARPTEGERE